MVDLVKDKQEIKSLFKQKKCCVLIPTYNNGSVLRQVIEDVQNYCDDIIVVNDGSTDNTPSIVDTFPTVLKTGYPKNRGKGFALRIGFQFALENGYDYAITIDSDGQHLASDLVTFLEKLEETPNSIIIGARRMNQESVPGKSSFGCKFSNFWFRLETGIDHPDTQSGYRLYPIKALSKMKFFTRKYEFEIEVIVRAAWKGIPVTHVPVDVFYPEKEKRITHFRPFLDFFRISILNTIFVTLTIAYYKPRDILLRYKKKTLKQIIKEDVLGGDDPSHRVALAIGFGVFMGIVPIWGYQLLVGFTIAHLLRINKAVFFLAANISLPPMIPLILYLSYILGGFALGEFSWQVDMTVTLETVGKNIKQYIIGSMILASVAGVLSGILSYPLLRLIKKK